MSEKPWSVHTIGDMYCEGCEALTSDGRWAKAVGMPYPGGKLRAAWWVLTGRAHAVIWPKPGDLEAALYPTKKHPLPPSDQYVGKWIA